MDLTLPVSGFILNIKAIVLLETQDGFVFEKNSKENYYVPVGGRIKIGETSMEGAKRELYEELEIAVDTLTYAATLENFFTYNRNPYHEFNFIYAAKVKKVKLPEGFKAIKKEALEAYEIQPKCIKTMLQSGNIPAHSIYNPSGSLKTGKH